MKIIKTIIFFFVYVIYTNKSYVIKKVFIIFIVDFKIMNYITLEFYLG